MRFLIFFLISIKCLAGEIKYPVSEIPEDLKKNNYAVIREEKTEFRILGINKSSYHERSVVTILNPNGKFMAKKVLGYGGNEKVQLIQASIYDEDGVLIKKLKSSDVTDQSAFDGFSLFSDNRVKRFDLTHNTYPYTVVFEYEFEFKYLYYIPPFYLYNDDEVGIQEKTYSLSYPENLKPRYKLLGVSDPVVEKGSGVEKLVWSFKNVKPDKWEKFSPDHHKFVPTILAAPNEFEYAGYSGKMDSWENLGKWQLLLNKGRDILPDAAKQKVAELTKGKSDEEKIKILYEYLQNRTRYVSIQLGIGGLQPFEAKVVDQVGYGDCKALSNYMVSLLKEAGIKGYYTTVYAGDNDRDVVTDFPSHQGNHVIVSVPLERDTVWLECTSQQKPFNFLGTFTSNRYAHLISEEGSKLVRTPSYKKEENIQVTKAVVNLEKTGKANAKVNRIYKGMLYDHEHVGYYTKLGSDKQKEWLEKSIEIPAFNLGSFSMKTVPAEKPIAEVQCDLFVPNCAIVQGKRMFLAANLMNKNSFVPEKTESRKTDIVQELPYISIDSIEYTFPEEFYPEFLPEPAKISTRFGEYECKYVLSSGKLVYIRKFSRNSGTFPKESYQEFLDFYKSINKADGVKIVFINKT